MENQLSTVPNPKLVVALDIGSTYSGYAWLWRSDEEAKLSNVEVNYNWGSGALQLLKTSTSLLLDANQKVNSIGTVAEKRYCRVTDQTKWYYFTQFKILLYGQDSVQDLKVKADNGTEFSLQEVMSKFVGALKANFLQMMREKDQTIDLKKTLWVITVPAIWSEQARSFMTEAALNAGISKNNLLLALEPEVASIYCLHKMPHVRDFGEKGSKYVTVDLGGGTVDITAFEVLDDGYLKEICIGNGGRVGGQDINSAFFQRWQEAFQKEDWEIISQHHTRDEIVKMQTDFEKEKVEIGSCDDIDDQICLTIPEHTKELLRLERIKLKDTGEANSIFKIEKGQFWFSSEVVRNDLFQETIKRITEIITEFFSSNGLYNIQSVVFVGGFAESKLVLDEIKKSLKEVYPNLLFVTPSSPIRAVLFGAVLYGHNPRIFRTRISRKTYGIRTSAFFDPQKHDKREAFRDPNDGELYIRGVFNVHVRKGEEVSLNNELTPVLYYPKREGAGRVRIRIYSSDDMDPQRISESGCREEGEILLELSENAEEEQEIAVRMIYGGTQIEVTAEEMATKRKCKAKIKFR